MSFQRRRRNKGTGGQSLIIDPVVIVGTPRSGTSTLFGAISSHPAVWSLYTESRFILDGPFHPRERRWESHVLTEDDFEATLAASLEKQFYRYVGNLERLPGGRLLPLRLRGEPRFTRAISWVSRSFKQAPLRIVEKTIPNILRTRLLKRWFPGARFLHIVRDPRSNIPAMYRGWRDPIRHHDFPLPPGFEINGLDRPYWSFVLPPGWRSQNGKRLMEVCAFQWKTCHERCLEDVASFDDGSYFRVRFEELIAHPMECLETIADWAGLDPEPFFRFADGLPRINPSRHQLREEIPEKELAAVIPMVNDVAQRLGY